MEVDMSEDYLGTTPIPGLTVEQQRACEAATKLGSAEQHDGIMRSIFAKLPGPPPWGQGAVNGAISSALTEAGIDAPWV
jgi:hypothetical protein